MPQDESRNGPIISVHGDALMVDDGLGTPLNLDDLIESSARDYKPCSPINIVIGAVADLALKKLGAFAKGESNDVETAWTCAEWLKELLPKMESHNISLLEDLALKVLSVLTQTRNSAGLDPLLRGNPRVFQKLPKFPELR